MCVRQHVLQLWPTYIRDEFDTFDFMLNSVIVAISTTTSIFQPLTLFFIDKVA